MPWCTEETKAYQMPWRQLYWSCKGHFRWPPFLPVLCAHSPPPPSLLAPLSYAPSEPDVHWILAVPRSDVAPPRVSLCRRCYDTVSSGLQERMTKRRDLLHTFPNAPVATGNLLSFLFSVSWCKQMWCSLVQTCWALLTNKMNESLINNRNNRIACT